MRAVKRLINEEEESLLSNDMGDTSDHINPEGENLVESNDFGKDLVSKTSFTPQT